MKFKIKYLSIPIILGIIALILITFTNDTKNISFKTFNDTLSYVEKGWIPDNIPENSKNINLSYDLDSNVINGKFILDSETDINNFKNSLSKLEDISSINLRSLNNEFKKLISQISSDKNSDNIFVYKDFVFLQKNESEFYFLSNEKA